MAQIIDLGKLRFSYQGVYSSSTTYEMNDVVKYGGNLYVYINATGTSNNTPTNTSYWSLMIEGFKFEGAYNNATAYKVGNAVAFGGIVYLAIADTTGNPPPNATYWSKFVDGIQYEGEYNPATEYQKSDLVKSGNNVYIAKQTTTGNAPTNTTYWDTFIDGFKFRGEWTSSTTYVVNEIVTRGGKVYICIESHSPSPAFATDLAANKWDEFGDGVRWRAAWTPSTSYLKGDLVSDSITTYIADSDFTSDSTSIENDTEWSVFALGADYLPAQSGNSGKFLTTDGTDASWDSPYPSQTGESGKFLTTDGTSVSWGSVDAFPDQTSNSGKLLTTDGTDVSWTDSISLSGSASIDGLVSIGPDANEFVDPPTVGEPSLVNPAIAVVFDNGLTESSYAQIAFQNRDSTSSTDIIAYMDTGNTDEGWIGMGISGSNFDDETYGITGPGDGYIFHNAVAGSGDAGNIVIATGANGTENKLIFAAGGFDSGLTQMEITPGVNVHVEIPTPSTSPTTGAFTVVGGVGIQGDMNIQGDVNVVGTITFGGDGTTVESANLTVVDPLVFVGSQNQNDIIDLGIIGEYAKDVADVPATVSNKVLTNNVATLTTTLAHGFNVGDIVVVTGVDSTFNGTFNVTATPSATEFSYAKTAGNVSSTAVSPTGTATKTRERRFAGVVRDATDGVIKFFHDATTKPASTVNFSEAGLAFSSIKVDGLEALGTVSLPATTSIGLVSGTELGYLDGVTSAIQTQLDAKANNLQTTTTPTFSANAYTLVLSDKDKFLLASNGATAGTVNIPTNSVTAFPTGTVITIVQTGTGQLTIGGAGVTIRSEGNKYKLKAQYASAQIIKIGTDEWIAIGNLAA